VSQLLLAARNDPQYQHLLQQGGDLRYTVRAGLLYASAAKDLGERVYVPAGDLRRQLLHEAHDGPIGGHLGRDKTLHLLQRQFFWPGMAREVAEHIATCRSCQASKPSNQLPIGLLQPLPVASGPWASISLDFTSMPRTPAGWDSCIVFVDRFTKFVRIVPTTLTVTAPQVAQAFITHVFRHGFGVPVSLVSDRDPRFTGHFWRALQSLMGTSLDMSSAYHPQSDGQTERANRTIKEMLRSCVEDHPQTWDKRLDMVEFAYNNSVHAATGFTPFYLNHGRHPRLPSSLVQPTPPGHSESASAFVNRLQNDLATATLRLEAARSRMAAQANVSRRPHTFVTGDLVWVSSENFNLPKLSPRFLGPFPVTKVLSEVAVQVLLDESLGRRHHTFHVSLLKPYLARTQATPPPPPPALLPAAAPLPPTVALPSLRRSERRSSPVNPVEAATVPVLRFVDDPQAQHRPPEVFSKRGVKYYVAEAITGERRLANGAVEVLVKWVGWPDYESTWEPRKNLLADAPELVADWLRSTGHTDGG